MLRSSSPKVPEYADVPGNIARHVAEAKMKAAAAVKLENDVMYACYEQYRIHIAGHTSPSRYSSCLVEECAGFNSDLRVLVTSRHGGFESLGANPELILKPVPPQRRKVTIIVEYFDGSERHVDVNASRGWKTSADGKWLVFGTGVPRVQIPMQNIKWIELQKEGE